MNHRLTHKTHDHTSGEEEQTSAASLAGMRRTEFPLEFDSVESLLRHDATEISPPPALTARVMDSIAREDSARPAPTPSPWWKRWLRL
jgi:hypothetical protein